MQVRVCRCAWACVYMCVCVHVCMCAWAGERVRAWALYCALCFTQPGGQGGIVALCCAYASSSTPLLMPFCTTPTPTGAAEPLPVGGGAGYGHHDHRHHLRLPGRGCAGSTHTTVPNVPGAMLLTECPVCFLHSVPAVMHWVVRGSQMCSERDYRACHVPEAAHSDGRQGRCILHAAELLLSHAARPPTDPMMQC